VIFTDGVFSPYADTLSPPLSPVNFDQRSPSLFSSPFCDIFPSLTFTGPRNYSAPIETVCNNQLFENLSLSLPLPQSFPSLLFQLLSVLLTRVQTYFILLSVGMIRSCPGKA